VIVLGSLAGGYPPFGGILCFHLHTRLALEDGGSMFLRNVHKNLEEYAVPQYRPQSQENSCYRKEIFSVRVQIRSEYCTLQFAAVSVVKLTVPSSLWSLTEAQRHEVAGAVDVYMLVFLT
jgi:hypothetical protein